MRVWTRVVVIGLVTASGCGTRVGVAIAADIFEDIVATSAPVLDIDPSLRSIGMGGASTAVFWDNDVNYWANPALLGSATGVRFEASDVSLLPEAIPGFKFKTRRATLGYGCLGVALVGEPFNGIGEQSLGGGSFPVTPNPFGQTLLLPRETARSWGAGVSVGRGLESLAHWRGNDAPAITRRNDVELGFNRKTVTDNTIEPTSPQHVTAYDYGVLARTSVPFRRTLGGVPGHVDIAYGFAVINANDAKLYDSPTARQHRNGGALRGSIDMPSAVSTRIPHWLSAGMRALVAVGFAYDANHVSAGSNKKSSHNVNEWGVELAMGGVLFGRVGGAHNTLGSGSTNNTWGVGGALPIGRWGLVRYDLASVDRELGGHLRPNSWSVQVDPIAIAKDLR